MKRRRREGPMLRRPISEDRFLDEIYELLERSSLDAIDVELDCPELDRAHRRNPRRFADSRPARREVRFAAATRRLPRAHRLGLVAHELGHLLAPRRHSEDDADRAARERLGVEVSYDRRWAGKGLQRGRKIR